MGYKDARILFYHILPNLLGPIIVYATLTVPAVMLLEAVLSFLGLGVQAPMASWGSLIKEGAEKNGCCPLAANLSRFLFLPNLILFKFHR